jgi:hypothetical protein
MMQKVGVVTLKSSHENLMKNYLKIREIKHSYLLVKAEEMQEYLACTMRSCFAVDKEFSKIKKSIEKYIKN